jgi:hypothetical protein
MQQATNSSHQPKVDAHVQPMSVGAAASAFVINLCSSTSPVALSPPDHAGLKRFTFFVSRRREEGRERFRLHMGYFETQEEAEKLLDIVREIYPGAWAGMAPGQRLRAAAAAAAKEAGAPIEQEVPPSAVANVAAAATPVTATSVSVPVSTSQPTPAVPPVTAAPQAIVASPVTGAPPVAASAAPNPQEEVSFELLPRHRAIVATAKPADTSAAMSEEAAAARSLSEVRAAIASLADTATRAPMLHVIPELKPPVNLALAKTAPLKVAPHSVPKPLQPAPELSDEAAMAVLESRAQDSQAAKVTDKFTAADAPAPEKAVYAVQLMWSVQPIDIAQIPQLAIFSAYTLYGAEGNRDGRRWYGLRLGFFTDAVSAKQVAHYVRSEFSTVSVVPVTPRERERAKVALARPAPAVAAVPARLPGTAPMKPVAPVSSVPRTQFEFIEDKPIVPTPSVGAKGALSRSVAGPRTGRGAPGKRAKLRTPAQAAARHAKPKKLTLEETLEILGAGDLKVDDGRGELINSETAANAAAPRPQPAKAKPSRLGRLFERLSERIGN